MSKIIEKAFDASKKIIRSIFRGSPNLITSSDLNRQFEAIKFQLDNLDEKTGFLSDINVKQKLSEGTLHVAYKCSYMTFKGCQFKPADGALTINLTRSASVAYLCLVADTKTIMYNDDDTHDIAGAKFEDGKTYPAADQLMYHNENLVLTHSLSSIPNLVGIVSVFTLSETGNVIVRNNVSGVETSLSLKSGGTISDLNVSAKGEISNGQTYDEAIAILNNRFVTLTTNWVRLTGDAENYIRVQNGVLMIDLAVQKISYDVPSRKGSLIASIGKIPEPLSQMLIAYFKNIGLRATSGFVGEVGSRHVMFGNFGAFALRRDFSAPKEYPEIEGTVNLVMYITHYNGNIEDVAIGAYIDHIIEHREDGIIIKHKVGPVNWVEAKGATASIPGIIGVIPMQGVF